MLLREFFLYAAKKADILYYTIFIVLCVSSMLSLAQFSELSLEQKQQMLMSFFAQLTDETNHTELDDISFLLEASTIYSDTTLISLYGHVLSILDMKKDEDQTGITNHLHAIHTQLEHEAQQSEDEADTILTTL